MGDKGGEDSRRISNMMHNNLVSYWMYVELIMFGRVKYLQLSH